MNCKLFACGDVVIQNNKTKIVEDNLLSIIKEADIAVCNFEAPIKTNYSPIPKAGPHLSQCIESIKILKEIGFTHFSMANNHIFDYGKDALSETIEKAEEKNITTIGAGDWENSYKLKKTKIKDTIFGFLSFADSEFGCMTENNGYGGYAYINHRYVNKIVSESKKEVDILIINCHAGIEHTNLPLPEWRERYKELCDYGADIIIGHHPHVPQAWEKYNDKLIFYSLGNFYFDYLKKEKDFSYSVLFNFEDKKLSSFEIIPHLHENGITKLQTEEKYKIEIENLRKILFENYNKNINNLALKLYSERYFPYYEKVANGWSRNMSFIKKLKRKLSVLLKREENKKQQELLLLHNIRIDSHRYITQRALHLLCEKKNH